MILPDWTIQLSHPTAGGHAASNTIADNIIFVSSKEGKQQFFRTLVDQQLAFTGDDYDYLKAIEDGADRCDEITITFTNGAFSRSYLISVTGAKFNTDLSQVSLKPRIDDRNGCFLDSWDDKFSIFTTFPSIDVTTYQGEIEIVSIMFTNLADINTPPAPTTDATDTNWQVLSLDALFGLTTWAGTIRYVRAIITTTCSLGVPVAPIGTGWTLRVDDCGGAGTAQYSKKVPLIRDPNQEYIATNIERNIYNVVPGYNEDSGTSIAIDNGRRLFLLMQNRYASECGGDVVSDLFTYNAPETNPTNAVYDQKSNVASLIIYQRSDVKRPNAFQDATQGEISMKEILEGLWSQHRAIWWIDASGDLRIEHESILDGSSAFDFTATHTEQIRGKNTYESLQDDFPRNQRTSFDESYGQQDFEGTALNYPNACSSGEEAEKMPWSTDVNMILATPDVASDAGFVMIAAILDGSDYYLPTEAGAITGKELLNGHLAISNLQEVYHQHRRPFISGLMHGGAHTFTSKKKSKAQEVSVIMSLTDYATFLTAIENPEADSDVTTELGVGEVAAATYDTKNQTLAIQINHD